MSFFPISLSADLAKTTGSMFTGNLVLSGGNLVVLGSETIDGRHVNADGLVLDAINTGTGILARTGTNTFSQLTLQGSVGEISVANGDGILGNPTFSLSNVGFSGTYSIVTTDAKGRVVSGTKPDTLAGYGIIDGVSVSSVSSTASQDTIVKRDTFGSFAANEITANLIGNATSATKFATVRKINGKTYDGTQDLVLTSDDLSEGTVNQYFTLARARGAISSTGAIEYNASTGAFSFTGVESVAGKTGNVSLAPADVGLANVANSLQVINSGGVPSIQSGLLASRPAALSSGRLFFATDTMEWFRDTGTGWSLIRSSFTGDVTNTVSSNVVSLVNVGTPGTYTKVTTDSKGRVISGSNPSTLSGMGITDGMSTSGSTMTGDLTFNGGNIVMTGGETVDGRDLSSDGAIIDAINQGLGFVARTNANLFSTRTLTGTANQVVVTDGDGVSGNPTVKLDNYVVMPGTSGLAIPTGTTAERPEVPVSGTMRFNTETSFTELWNGSDWVEQINEKDLRITEAKVLVVKKNPGKGQFATISSAMDYLASLSTISAGPAIDNLFVIRVSPGVYVEPTTVVVPSYVHITGEAQHAAVIRPETATQDVFSITGRASLNFLTIENAGPGFAGIKVADMNDWALVHKIEMNNCDIGVDMQSNTGRSAIYIEYMAINGGTRAIRTQISNDFSIFINAENFYIFPDELGVAQQIGVQASGVKCRINLRSFGLFGGEQTGIGLQALDGAKISASGGTITDWDSGVVIGNAGVGSSATFVGIEFKNNLTYDLNVEHPAAIGSLFGVADKNKVNVDPLATFTVGYSDPANNGFVTTGSMFVGDKHQDIVDVTSLLIRGMQLGLMDGGTLTKGTGLVIIAAPGSGYCRTGTILSKVSWVETTITCTDNTTGYIYAGSDGVLRISTTLPDTVQNIVLGRFMTANGAVAFCGPLGSTKIDTFNPNLDKIFREAIGTLYVAGSIVSENSLTPRAIDVTAGHYFYSTNEVFPAAATAPGMYDVHHSSGTVVFTPVTTISNTHYDDGTNLVALSPGYYTKHTIYTVGSGVTTGYLINHGNGNFATLQEAIDAPLSPPLMSPEGSPPIATIIVQQGTSNIVEIIDVRPVWGTAAGTSSSSAGSSRHGDLTGLGSDDHQQYLLSSGLRSMSGNLDLGNYSITNTNLINGVSITSHSSRHLPNGSDPLATAAPTSTLSASSINSEGIANSYSRSDHTHSLAGVQASSADLTAIAAISTTGLIRKTGAGTWVGAATVNPSEINGNIPVSKLNSGTNASTSTFWRGDGVWAVTDGVKSVGLVAPAAGITVSGGPITTTGSFTLALGDDLAAIEDLSTSGFAVRTGTNTWVTRAVTGVANQIAVTNGTGVTGVPTIGLANNITIPGTESLTIPKGTTSERPLSPIDGMLRFNTTDGCIETYSSSSWHRLAKVGGDTFLGPMAFNDSIAARSYIDMNTQTTPSLPSSGVQRFFAKDVDGFSMIETIDSTGFTSRLFRDNLIVVKNNTASGISKGKAVYITGSSNSTLHVAMAIATSDATMPVIGIAAEDIQAGQSGRVIISGRIAGVDTSAFAVGDTLWVSNVVAGALTATAPAHPAISQPVATVVVSDSVSGELVVFVRGEQGKGFGTTNANFTIGTSSSTSMVLVPSSTAKRTFTFPDVSGTIVTSNNLPTITIGGDATGSGTSSIQVTLANTGVVAGTYSNVTVDEKGRVLSGSNASSSIAQVFAGNIAQTSGTSLIPADNTTPLPTEGTLLMSQTINPLSATSKFKIELSTVIDSGSNNRQITIAVFRNDIFVGCVMSHFSGSSEPKSVSLLLNDMPGSTAPVTYTMRIGSSTSGSSWYFGRAASATYGGTNPSGWNITEIL